MNKYYVIYPNGREKLKATDLISAMIEYREHWTATCNYIKGRKPLVRKLIEERQEVILVDELEGS